MASISISEIEKVILASDPQVFEVIYEKRTTPGVLRHMRCIHGVKYKGPKSPKKKPKVDRKKEDHAKKLLTVFDIEAREKKLIGGWRRINLRGVRQLKINGEQFDVL